jgi:putative oxidoreductase
MVLLTAEEDRLMHDKGGGTRSIAVRILRVVLGLAFLVIAAVKLTGSLQTVQMFENIGWGQWFRYFTGGLDLIGAVLVLVPRSAFYGAVLLMCTVGFAVVLTVVGRIHDSLVPPLALTVLAATVAWLTRPRPEKIRVIADAR